MPCCPFTLTTPPFDAVAALPLILIGQVPEALPPPVAAGVYPKIVEISLKVPGLA
jgi:hypothetical protein